MTDVAHITVDAAMLPEPLRHVMPRVRGLWWAGDITCLARGIRIGVIGSRHPRADSEQHARTIARDAGRIGFTVVSGLAIGIDGIAHRAALDAGADTVAVLAGGLAHVHPARHRDLARRIAGSRRGDGVAGGPAERARGLLLSEYGAGVEPSLPGRFKDRNRIIAALCDYVVVIQAQHRSGSMSTVRAALDLGVPVGIVPSGPEDPCYSGSLDLIREGADCVVDGVSLCRRLELHGIVASGFTEAVRQGATLDPDLPGRWIEQPDLPVGPAPLSARLVDHPLASILDVPRQLDEIAELAGLSVRDARRMLLELEESGDAAFTASGTWVVGSRP